MTVSEELASILLMFTFSMFWAVLAFARSVYDNARALFVSQVRIIKATRSDRLNDLAVLAVLDFARRSAVWRYQALAFFLLGVEFFSLFLHYSSLLRIDKAAAESVYQIIDLIILAAFAAMGVLAVIAYRHPLNTRRGLWWLPRTGGA
jgi:hypothetical protein